MLRITVMTETNGTTIALEGRLIGPWVDELASCWRSVRPSPVRPICINLDCVSYVDEGGQALLWALYAEGAVLTASGPMMRALIDTIAARSKPGDPR